ncbi:peptidylprolyl isomerase [Roseibium sp.]|uniref:peptidylprolyl isomerase n=1 Tax=Roseibium sp. TaxID=1936156 RepID=UPI0039EFBF4B
MHARHILVENENEALGIKSRIEGGADFASIAKQYSIGPSASKGGDIGWFGKGVMVPEFEKAAFALKVGEVSNPVKTVFGWHVIQLLDVETQSTSTTKTSDSVQSEKANNAAVCGSIYFISTTMFQGNDQAIDAMISVQDIFGRVFAVEEEKRLNSPVSKRAFQNAKELLVKPLAELYKNEPSVVYGLEMQCNAWKEQIISHVQANGSPSDPAKNKSALLSAPNVPEMPAESDPRWNRAVPFVDGMFKAYFELTQ